MAVAVFTFLSNKVIAAADDPSFGYTYNNEDVSPYLGRYLSIFKDSSGIMGIQDVLRSGTFHKERADIPDLGLNGDAYWAKLDLYNITTTTKLFVHISQSEIDMIDIYKVNDGHISDQVIYAGLARKISTQTQPSSELAFPISVQPISKTTLYIRIQSNKPVRLPITIKSVSGFSQSQISRSLLLGAYLGIMLVMALYNLFLFLFIREKTYGIYVLYIVLVGLTQMAFIGLLSFTILSNYPWLSSHSPLYLTAATAIVAGEFMIDFIHIRSYYPKVIKYIRAFYGILITGIAMDIAGYQTEAYQLLQLCAGTFAFFQLSIISWIGYKGSRPARFFLIAWVAFLCGIIVFILKDIGLLPYNDLTRYAMTIGSTIEVVLLSFGLADKINLLRREKERSQMEALRFAKENERIIMEQNIVLDGKVRERTHALQESNDHLKRTQSQLVNAEKMASLGQLTAGIAHEINNPINFISSNIPPLKRDLVDLKEVLEAYQDAARNNPGFEHVRELERRIDMPVTVSEVQEIMDCIEQGANRTSEIVRGLRTFSRLDEDDLKQADVNEGLRSTTVVLAPQFRDAVKINFNLGAVPEVECYPGKLNQAFMNLLNNAAHAVKKRHGLSGGEVSIGTELCGDEIKITIADNGIGMDEKVQERLFEPFFTTKEVGEGTGLGLSITQGIIEKHHGRLELESAVGVGSTFIITLPVTQAAALEKRA